MNTYTIFPTDWGYMAAIWSPKGLWELSFPRASQAEALLDVDASQCRQAEVDELSLELSKQLNIYFRGFYVYFDVPIDWSHYTPFQAAVLEATLDIPYGKTKSYKEVAAVAGSPQAARAVGSALHGNRTPIVVPCHRVVGTDGSLTGFGGGLEMKKALLLLEKSLS